MWLALRIICATVRMVCLSEYRLLLPFLFLLIPILMTGSLFPRASREEDWTDRADWMHPP